MVSGQAVNGQVVCSQTINGQASMMKHPPPHQNLRSPVRWTVVNGQVVCSKTINGQASMMNPPPSKTPLPGQVVSGQAVNGQVVRSQTINGQASMMTPPPQEYRIYTYQQKKPINLTNH